jgi:hypothetical protein
MRDLAVNSQLEYRYTELANVQYALYVTVVSSRLTFTFLVSNVLFSTTVAAPHNSELKSYCCHPKILTAEPFQAAAVVTTLL